MTQPPKRQVIGLLRHVALTEARLTILHLADGV